MTVNTTARRVIGFGNGVTTVWPYAFLIPLATEISVVYTNPNRDAIDPTGTGVVLNPAAYTVTGIGNPGGGNVTYPLAGAPVAAPITITIVRTIPKTQPTTMANQGGAYPAAYEAALDNVEMQLQEVAEIFLRTPSLPIGFDAAGQGVSLVLPPPTPNAFIGWDATGKFLQNLLSAASLIAPVAVGQIPFGAAVNTLAQDANLVWDNAGKRLITFSVGAPAGFGLNLISNNINQWQIQSAGHFMALSGDNILDIGASGSNRPRTGYFGTSIVTPLVTNAGTFKLGPSSANFCELQTSGTTRWLVDVDAANSFVPQTDGLQDLGHIGNKIRTGYFGTSVVTPQVGNESGTTALRANGATAIQFSNATFNPNADLSMSLGTAALRYNNVFTPIIDSGTAGSLSLKTNNGATQVEIAHTAGTNFPILSGSATGVGVALGASGTSADTNVATRIGSKGTGTISFESANFGVIQLQVLHTAAANRNVTITGSNGGNPTIGATAGGVAIVGTPTNDNAATGQYGEYISSTIATGASVALATGVTSNITSITLGAGDWDVSGCIAFTFGATTSYTNLVGGASSATGALGAQETTFDYETPATVPTAGKDMSWPVPTQRFSLAGSTTIFLVAQGTFTVSTLKAYGILRARRVR